MFGLLPKYKHENYFEGVTRKIHKYLSTKWTQTLLVLKIKTVVKDQDPVKINEKQNSTGMLKK